MHDDDASASSAKPPLLPAKVSGKGRLGGGLRLSVQVGAEASQDRICLENDRPMQACQVLVGRPVDAALSVVPLMFSLCGQAQKLAAQRAVDAALGHQPDVAEQRRRQLVIAAEAVQESLLPMVLSWPAEAPVATGDSSATELEIEALRHVRSLASTVFRAADLPAAAAAAHDLACFVDQMICGSDDADAPLGPRLDKIASLLNSPAGSILHRERGLSIGEIGSSGPFRPLSVPSAQHAASLLMAEGFRPDVPTHGCLPWECGALGRSAYDPHMAELLSERGSDLFTRYRARVHDLLAYSRLLRDGGSPGLVTTVADDARDDPTLWSDPDQPGCGVGIAETARGTLIHRVRVTQGVIRSWQIVAPTEWTFHPQGVVVEACRDLCRRLREGMQADRCGPEDGQVPATDWQGFAEWALAWVVRVFDPCVPCVVTVSGPWTGTAETKKEDLSNA